MRYTKRHLNDSQPNTAGRTWLPAADVQRERTGLDRDRRRPEPVGIVHASIVSLLILSWKGKELVLNISTTENFRYG